MDKAVVEIGGESQAVLHWTLTPIQHHVTVISCQFGLHTAMSSSSGSMRQRSGCHALPWTLLLSELFISCCLKSPTYNTIKVDGHL